MFSDLQPLLGGTADAAWLGLEAGRLTSLPQFRLLDLVTELGPVLTSTNTPTR